MTPPEHLTVRSPQDVLGFIPHSLGYWPSASLVAMTLQGKRLGATLRLDLPAPEVLAQPAAFARTVCAYLEADQHADGSLLALFTNNGWLAGPDGYGSLLAELQWTLDHAGMPVRDAWYVGSEYWRDAFCADPACCPFPGRPVQEIRDSTLNAEMVYRGSSVGPPPHEQPAAVLPGSSLHCAAVREAEEAWSAELDLRRGSRGQFDAVLGLWTALLNRPPGEPWLPEADRDGFLRATLLVPGWRDAVLMMAAAGRRAAEAGAEQFAIFRDECRLDPVAPPAGPPGAGPAEEVAGLGGGVSGRVLEVGVPCYGDVLMGIQPAVPDWERLDALDLVLQQLAAAGGPAAAASLTGRGWIAWCRGRGSFSAAHLAQALEIEPGYRLAELLLEMVHRGTICGWAARKEAAWQKFGPDAA
ncbi:DUF4192 family protein [Arthrobacter sp. BB-1]|uniref:DUF4192 family protein n=1 Tax=unclassified Arthrobacter TaxID=235627 RepID=UPI001111C9CA|nr:MULTISPECIES: DUF4192 family protein [unclassified Arthrobacter]TNB72886.1 DUF4192 family protein [Arthrobacter sp. BB-1]